MPKTWNWYYSHNEEFWYGPYGSREEAVEELDGEAGYVGEHCQPNIHLGAHFDVSDFFQNAYELIDEQWGDPEGGGVETDIIYTDKQADDLQARVSAAINRWQVEQQIEIRTWRFAGSRNVEFVDE